jgi:hypothetical protein
MSHGGWIFSHVKENPQILWDKKHIKYKEKAYKYSDWHLIYELIKLLCRWQCVWPHTAISWVCLKVLFLLSWPCLLDILEGNALFSILALRNKISGKIQVDIPMKFTTINSPIFFISLLSNPTIILCTLLL